MSHSQKFADLGRPRRIWAVGAVHGEEARLAALHDAIAGRFLPGDRLVYLGNLLGHSVNVIDTLDEILLFRRRLIAQPGVLASDVVYLRGCQEEMWQKLLQLQFAPNPREVLDWMLRNGVEQTLAAYGGNVQQGLSAAREGAVSITRWTNALRVAIRAVPGHDPLMSALRRAAYTRGSGGMAEDPSQPPPGVEPDAILLVSAGVDVIRPFGAQGDSFWWGGTPFARIQEPYGRFRKVIRGYDPARGGLQSGDFTLTLDGNAGFGGPLVAGCLTPQGDVIELLES